MTKKDNERDSAGYQLDSSEMFDALLARSEVSGELKAYANIISQKPAPVTRRELRHSYQPECLRGLQWLPRR